MTHFGNSEVIGILEEHYPKFKRVDCSKLSAEETDHWYSAYLAIRTVLTERKTGRGNAGYFNSVKSNKRIYCRSSYELDFTQILEDDLTVMRFETEPYHIKFKDNAGKNGPTFLIS